LSEQFPSEAAPPEEEISPQPAELPEADEPAERRERSGWIAPAWFFFGIIVGIVGFAAYNALIVKPTTTAQVESLDSAVAMRAAARDGTLDAIATLQAGGGQPAAQEPQGPQAVGNDSFTVREANRQGNANATVTVYEFSDFQ
jgi:hypothetical protein